MMPYKNKEDYNAFRRQYDKEKIHTHNNRAHSSIYLFKGILKLYDYVQKTKPCFNEVDFHYWYYIDKQLLAVAHSCQRWNEDYRKAGGKCHRIDNAKLPTA